MPKPKLKLIFSEEEKFECHFCGNFFTETNEGTKAQVKIYEVTYACWLSQVPA